MPEAKQTTVTAFPSDLDSAPTLDGGPPARFDAGSSFETLARSLDIRYDELRMLGRGGMGVVYLGRDKETGDRVALKVLRSEVSADAEYLDRFKGELRLARKVTHKNVCRTHELMRFGDTAVISMEYVEGETLRAFLAHCRGVPLRRGLVWARQICSALAEAHAQGVVHRDLKPDNIQIDRSGDVKIMDFGIARSVADEATGTGHIVGTPAYMSPEQLSGKAVDARSDLYSLGLILFEMFVGRPAFAGDTPTAQALIRLTEQAPDPKDAEPLLPAFLAQAIARCLERDPNRRFANASELGDALAGKDAAPEPDKTDMPARLTQPGRVDLALLAIGILGLVAYVLLWPTVTPESAVRIRVTDSMIIERGRAEIERRTGQPVTNAGRVMNPSGPLSFRALSKSLGYAEAQRRSGQDLPPFLYTAVFDDSVRPKGSDSSMSVTYDPRGELIALNLPARQWARVGPGLPTSEAMERAISAVREAFGAVVGQTELETQGTLSEEGRQGSRFSWAKKETTGLVWHYQADVFDRVGSLKRWPTVGDSERAPKWAELVVIAWGLVLLACLSVFIARKLWTHLDKRQVAVLSALAAAVGAKSAEQELWRDPVKAVVTALLFASVFIIPLLIGTRVLVYLGRHEAHLLASFADALHLRSGRALSLSIPRGIVLGLGALGLRAVTERLGIGSGYSSDEISSMFQGVWFMACVDVPETLLLSGAGAFLILLAKRRVTSTPLLAVLGALAAAAGTFGPSSNPANTMEAALMGALFVVAFLSFDLVTALMAAITSGTLSIAFTMIKVTEPIGNGSAWLLVAFGIAVFAWGVWTGYQPLWSRARSRIAEAID